MFLWMLQWQMPLYLRANHVWVFCWAWPRFFLLFLLVWRRNASLAGGFAGRLVLWCWFYCDLICRFTGTGQLRYVPLFSPLMFLSGPCHSAFTANLEEKKNWDTIILLEGVPSRWLTKVRRSSPRKLLEF